MQILCHSSAAKASEHHISHMNQYIILGDIITNARTRTKVDISESVFISSNINEYQGKQKRTCRNDVTQTPENPTDRVYSQENRKAENKSQVHNGRWKGKTPPK